MFDLHPELPSFTSPDSLPEVTTTPSMRDESKNYNDPPDHQQNLLLTDQQTKSAETDHPQPILHRHTRSGKVYFGQSDSHPPTTAGDPRVQKRVRFQQSVDFCEGGKIYKIQLNDLYKKTSNVRIMLHMVALDFSKQEIFYKTKDVRPNLLHLTYENKD